MTGWSDTISGELLDGDFQRLIKQKSGDRATTRSTQSVGAVSRLFDHNVRRCRWQLFVRGQAPGRRCTAAEQLSILCFLPL